QPLCAKELDSTGVNASAPGKACTLAGAPNPIAVSASPLSVRPECSEKADVAADVSETLLNADCVDGTSLDEGSCSLAKSGPLH
ncbi:MAG TPA: hypothetical protein VNW46_11325, partial [Gemmatimonadaceae bacterium]|nr:hypothetical protein [Gemmatimonadaceae bacterium]